MKYVLHSQPHDKTVYSVKRTILIMCYFQEFQCTLFSLKPIKYKMYSLINTSLKKEMIIA